MEPLSLAKSVSQVCINLLNRVDGELRGALSAYEAYEFTISARSTFRGHSRNDL